MQSIKNKIQKTLISKPQWVFVIFASLAAFLTYSCMYAFRKTFTVATFDNEFLFGIDYKIWLITSQLIGYTLSKFIGIKLVSEMKPQNRAKYILIVIGIAQLALFLFAVTPPPWNIVWMFLNGLPLGVVWGLVFSYIEGRKTTEILGAVLSISFIFASGFVKSVGKYILLHYKVSEYWMPFVVGTIFIFPLIISVWLLNMIPPPDAKDVELRMERLPMTGSQRKEFLVNFVSILIPLTTIYVFLTILRDIRDNFAAEIWLELGMGNAPEIFTTAEIPVGLGVLLIIALMVFVKNNRMALHASLALIAIGIGICAVATIAFNMNMLSGILWMIMIGFGLYLGYISYQALLFERFIATFKQAGNIGFLFYFSDAIGYLGSVSTFVMKNFFSPTISWVKFLSNIIIYLSAVSVILFIYIFFSMQKKYRSVPTTNIQIN
jgi:MFS family permease